MKRLFSVLKYVIVLFVIFVAAVALLPWFPAFGNFQSLVVLSGSMEPEIKTGSIVLVRAESVYQVGDVVTFEEGSNFVTHRIVTISEGQKLITRGDANKSADTREISTQQIRGKVIFYIPYLGYASNFARTRLGFALFIILPAVLIIIDEVFDLIRGENKSIFSKAKSLCILILFFVSAFASGISLAYFSDTEASLGNVINVGVWGEEPQITSVVVNEIYYDVAPGQDEGNKSNPDEWVELYNNTNNPINLKDWTIEDNSSSTSISHANVYIPANGFALLAKSAKTWTFWSIPSSAEKISLGQKIGNGLGNSGDRLILKDSGGSIIDAMSYGSDNSVWNPDCPDVAEGHSLERDPAGKDTDVRDDFIDQTTPTPGSGL